MAVKILYSTQRGHRQVEVILRSIFSQPIHQVSYLQNVNTEGSEDVVTSRPFHNITRSKGWVLTCFYYTEEETLFRVRIPEHHVAVQKHVIPP